MSNILETERKDKGITIVAMARRMGVSRQTIYNWEHGASIPDAEQVNLLSDILGIPSKKILAIYK